MLKLGSCGRVMVVAAALACLPHPRASTDAQELDLGAVIRAKAPSFSGTVLAAKGRDVVFHQSSGLANRAFDVPNTNDTRYKIASITKLFTAVIVLQLQQEKKLEVDRTIAAYLPACAGPIASAATVHQLLNHTSGIADIVAVTSKEQGVREGVELYQRPYTTDEILARYCAAPPRDLPGQSFFYNNGDYVVLGKIIERLEGQPFGMVLDRRILGPLGMRNSGMHAQHRVLPKLAETYFTRDDADGILANDLPVYIENWYAAGAMYSTTADLLLFAEALFGGHLLAPASMARLMQPGLENYGYGAWIYADVIDGRTRTSVMRPGQIMGVNTVLYRVIDPAITVVVLSNTDKTNVDALAHRLSEVLAR